MAVKTITIDMEAYSLLQSEKKSTESFSKLIKRRMKPANTANRLLEALDFMDIENETIEHIEQVYKDRSKDMIDSPIIAGDEA